MNSRKVAYLFFLFFLPFFAFRFPRLVFRLAAGRSISRVGGVTSWGKP